MTEGKSAALHRLAVPSKLHVDLATGTGTDQYCIAAPSSGARALTSASPHMKLGELVGLRDAQRHDRGAALAERPRSQLHARRVPCARPLRREGSDALRRHRAAARRGRSRAAEEERKAVFYEPLVGAAAHALATVCDRVRYGTIPEAVAADAMVQQAAALAANLAAQVHRWAEFRALLRPHAERRREDAGAQGAGARLVRKVAHRVSRAARAAVAGCRCCWRSASSPISRSAIRSTPGIRCG